MYLWVKGIQVRSNEESFNSHKVDNKFFLHLIKIVIIILSVYRFEQVSIVAHGPLVILFFQYRDLCQVVLIARSKPGAGTRTRTPLLIPGIPRSLRQVNRKLSAIFKKF